MMGKHWVYNGEVYVLNVLLPVAFIDWLKENGFTSADISMKGIGYKELLDHLSGAYDLPHAVDLIKKNTRHYAKRQMTWFKRYEEMQWFDITHDIGDEETVEKIMSWLNKKR